MLIGIDHLVIAVSALDAAIATYRALGFTVVPGGRHPIGTENALIAFRDGSYLELIAFLEPRPQHRWYQRLQQGGALIDYCLATDDLSGDARALRDAGVALADPRPLSRVRPDGYELRWVLAIPDEHAGVAPFLIEDETPRGERVPAARTHANGATGMRALTVAVDDAATVRGWYERAPGAKVASIERQDLGASGTRVTLGPHALDFVAARGPESTVASWLGARGASPYAVALSGPPVHERLSLDRTMGVRVAIG